MEGRSKDFADRWKAMATAEREKEKGGGGGRRILTKEFGKAVKDWNGVNEGTSYLYSAEAHCVERIN